MSLETPEKIRNLQRKLYCKAKAEPAYRFYLLYDKICREDILRHAYALARAKAGAPGVDGVTFEQIDVANNGASHDQQPRHTEGGRGAVSQGGTKGRLPAQHSTAQISDG